MGGVLLGVGVPVDSCAGVAGQGLGQDQWIRWRQLHHELAKRDVHDLGVGLVEGVVGGEPVALQSCGYGGVYVRPAELRAA